MGRYGSSRKNNRPDSQIRPFATLSEDGTTFDRIHVGLDCEQTTDPVTEWQHSTPSTDSWSHIDREKNRDPENLSRQVDGDSTSVLPPEDGTVEQAIDLHRHAQIAPLSVSIDDLRTLAYSGEKLIQSEAYNAIRQVGSDTSENDSEALKKSLSITQSSEANIDISTHRLVIQLADSPQFEPADLIPELLQSEDKQYISVSTDAIDVYHHAGIHPLDVSIDDLRTLAHSDRQRARNEASRTLINIVSGDQIDTIESNGIIAVGNSASTDLRLLAARELATLVAASPQLFPDEILYDLLSFDDEEVLSLTCQAIYKIVSERPETVESIIDQITTLVEHSSLNNQGCIAAGRTLAYMNKEVFWELDFPISALQSLRDCENSSLDEGVAYAWKTAAANRLNEIIEATEELYTLLDSDDPAAQAHALEAISYLSSEYPGEIKDISEKIKGFAEKDQFDGQRYAVLALCHLTKKFPAEGKEFVSEFGDVAVYNDGFGFRPHFDSAKAGTDALGSIVLEYPQEKKEALYLLASGTAAPKVFDYRRAARYISRADPEFHATLVPAYMRAKGFLGGVERALERISSLSDNPESPQTPTQLLVTLQNAIDREEKQIRESGLDALSFLTKRDPDAVLEVLIKCIQDPDISINDGSSIQLEIVRQLRNLSKTSPEELPPTIIDNILICLNSDNKDVRIAATEALDDLTYEYPDKILEAVPTLRMLLNDLDQEKIRKQTVATLIGIGSVTASQLQEAIDGQNCDKKID